jgi:hypothetical protein
MNDPVVEKIFEEDIEKAVGLLTQTFPPFEDEKEQVEILTDHSEIQEALTRILEREQLISFDYESTGLKPHAPEHKIVSCSIAWKKDQAIAFPYLNRIRPLLSEILKSPRIYKVAHHLQFEDMWTRKFSGYPVSPWGWDTLLAAHVIDNRRSICSLKFQTYVNFGVVDYDSHLSHFLRSEDSKNGNAVNNIQEIDLMDLLLYNGLDSIFGYKLMLKQMIYFGIIDPLQYMKKGIIPKAREFDFAKATDVNHKKEQKIIRHRRIRRKAYRT